MKGLLHSHTGFSICSTLSLEHYIEVCQNKGFDFVAVTDHDTIVAAQELQRIAPFRVIVGQEITSADGEIIGLFLEKEIPKGLSAKETFAAIKGQGGLVYLPHPFDTTLRRPHKRLNVEAILPIIDMVDIVEVANARNIFDSQDRRAKEFAQTHAKVESVGADSHFAGEIGKTYVEMDDFDSPSSFLRALEKGTLHFQRSSPLFHLRTFAVKRYKKFFS